MNKDKVLYIAGPYTGPTHDYQSYTIIDQHINEARKAAHWCAINDIFYFCPHLHAAHNEVILPQVRLEYWYELDQVFLGICQGLLLLQEWYTSHGTREEIRLFKGDSIFIFPIHQLEILRWAKS